MKSFISLNRRMVQGIRRCPRIDFLFNFVVTYEEILCNTKIAFKNLTKFVLTRINITVRIVQRIHRCPRTFSLLNFVINLEGVTMKKCAKFVLNIFVTAESRWAITAATKFTEITKDPTRNKFIVGELSKWLELALKISRANKKPFNLYKTTCSSHFDKPYTRHKIRLSKRS